MKVQNKIAGRSGDKWKRRARCSLDNEPKLAAVSRRLESTDSLEFPCQRLGWKGRELRGSTLTLLQVVALRSLRLTRRRAPSIVKRCERTDDIRLPYTSKHDDPRLLVRDQVMNLVRDIDKCSKPVKRARRVFSGFLRRGRFRKRAIGMVKGEVGKKKEGE